MPVIDDAAMELSQLYRSSAIIGAGKDLPPALRPDQWAGQPGTRAPHLWVSRNGAKVSTLDLVQPDWVLLTEDNRWGTAAQAAAERLEIKLACVTLASAGEADPAVSTAPLDTPLAVIAANAAGKRLLETTLPQLVGHKNYESVKSMSLRELQPVSQGKITDKDLAAMESALTGVRFADTTKEPDDPEAFRKAFGIGPAGASLVRPDGYVAWRSLDMPADPTAAVIDALGQAAFAKTIKP